MAGGFTKSVCKATASTGGHRRMILQYCPPPSTSACHLLLRQRNGTISHQFCLQEATRAECGRVRRRLQNRIQHAEHAGIADGYTR